MRQLRPAGRSREHFVTRVLPDSAANQDTAPFLQRYVKTPHSVVTAHLIDEAGQLTMAAREEILRFVRTRPIES